VFYIRSMRINDFASFRAVCWLFLSTAVKFRQRNRTRPAPFLGL
jgi:hypothetical protein